MWPELSHSGRPYSQRWEKGNWSLQAALGRLACFVVQRRVSKQGRISLYDRAYHVGVSRADQEVLVQLSPERVAWIVSDRQDREIRALPASTLTHKNIVTLLEL